MRASLLYALLAAFAALPEAIASTVSRLMAKRIELISSNRDLPKECGEGFI